MNWRDLPDSLFSNLDAYRNLPQPLVLSVSGGRSSGLKAAHFVKANGGLPSGTIAVFENTGLEDAETYHFLDRVDRFFQLGLTWLEFDHEAPTGVRVVDFATASRNGEPMERLLTRIVPVRRDGTAGVQPLPNPVQRSCTAQLKVKTLHRYVRRHLGWGTKYYATIGYRADEQDRRKRKEKLDAKGFDEGGRGVFPMADAGVLEDDTLTFWRAMPFDLGIDGIFGNCDFCFMAAAWKIKERMRRVAEQDQIFPMRGGPIPARIARWIAWEERQSDRPGNFRKDRPNMRALWNEVCDGDLFTASDRGNGDLGYVCGSCTD